jgi:hypothetical protein
MIPGWSFALRMPFWVLTTLTTHKSNQKQGTKVVIIDVIKITLTQDLFKLISVLKTPKGNRSQVPESNQLREMKSEELSEIQLKLI